MSRSMGRAVLVAVVVCSTAVASLAQQSSVTTETKTFEVLAVDGNQLVVRLPEGTREMTVADDFRFTVNGQPMSVHELKPGMKGTAVITTRTTPIAVTEVKNGTVVKRAGSTIIVRTDEGVRSFTTADADRVKIIRDGQPVSLSEIREGDSLTATIITPLPPRVLTEREVNATLAAAEPELPPVAEAPQPTATAGTLPKTASAWPLLGFASVLSLAMGLGLTLRRRFAD